MKIEILLSVRNDSTIDFVGLICIFILIHFKLCWKCNLFWDRVRRLFMSFVLSFRFYSINEEHNSRLFCLIWSSNSSRASLFLLFYFKLRYRSDYLFKKVRCLFISFVLSVRFNSIGTLNKELPLVIQISYLQKWNSCIN